MVVNDAIIVGAGLAGKAAAIHLAKSGLHVVCIEPERPLRSPVGESLDWSAPDLLKSLGLSMDELVDRGMGTWKRHVTLNLMDGVAEHYAPTEHLARRPWKVELRTLHVNRELLDNELLRIARQTGVAFVAGRVTAVERQGKRITGVRTASGDTLNAKWFIDASGFATSLFGRTFDLPLTYYGPPKVALWTYFTSPRVVEGTTLYMAPEAAKYLDWVWEIPINAETVSVGYIGAGTEIKQQREEGLSPAQILDRKLSKFSHFEPLMSAGTLCPVHVTSFRGRTYRQLTGPNWILAGEAAAMVDPITSNGVTAALRHGSESADLIIQAHRRSTLSHSGRMLYQSRVRQVAAFFNTGIEKIVYEPAVRNRTGLARSGKLYTGPAWMMNLIYSRMKPRGFVSTLLLNTALATFRAGAILFQAICRIGNS